LKWVKVAARGGERGAAPNRIKKKGNSDITRTPTDKAIKPATLGIGWSIRAKSQTGETRKTYVKKVAFGEKK